jgi:hypothetical protein
VWVWLTLRRIVRGTNAHVAFDERDACRVVFHRERLSPADGAQALQLDVEVTGVDGSSRPEAHVTESVAMRATEQPNVVWIKGVVGSFDRVTLRVSHAVGEASYVDRAAVPTGEPSVPWSVVFGTGHYRLYATTAIPTGMYRVSDRGTAASCRSTSASSCGRRGWTARATAGSSGSRPA